MKVKWNRKKRKCPLNCTTKSFSLWSMETCLFSVRGISSSCHKSHENEVKVSWLDVIIYLALHVYIFTTLCTTLGLEISVCFQEISDLLNLWPWPFNSDRWLTLPYTIDWYMEQVLYLVYVFTSRWHLDCWPFDLVPLTTGWSHL